MYIKYTVPDFLHTAVNNPNQEHRRDVLCSGTDLAFNSFDHDSIIKGKLRKS